MITSQRDDSWNRPAKIGSAFGYNLSGLFSASATFRSDCMSEGVSTYSMGGVELFQRHCVVLDTFMSHFPTCRAKGFPTRNVKGASPQSTIFAQSRNTFFPRKSKRRCQPDSSSCRLATLQTRVWTVATNGRHLRDMLITAVERTAQCIYVPQAGLCHSKCNVGSQSNSP